MTTDINRSGASTVTGSKVLVAGEDSVGSGELTVLLVHVVGARARVVANPDAKVLHFERLFLRNLRHTKDDRPRVKRRWESRHQLGADMR